MAFITKDDFITIISVPALDSLTESNDAIIDTMVVEAILEMTSYLEARYDVTELFPAEETFHPTIQMYCKDIVLYHLHSRHHQKPMPDIRLKRYQKAMQWLQDVQEQKLNPFAYLEGLATPKSLIATGGNEKREYHQL